MKKIAGLTLLLAVAAAPAWGAQQLYRWVNEQGVVEWRDTPPPAGARQVERRNVGASTISTSTLPYSVQQAAKNFPVTLWTEDCGAPCNNARAHLQRRGVPYTEKNPRADLDAFKTATGGGMQVPLLVVGNNKLKGYLDTEWDAALDAAGYPRTASVGYKPPPPAKAPPPEAGTASAPPPPAAAQ